MIFGIVKFGKFDDFRNCKIWETFGIFRIEHFWNYLTRQFLKFSKLNYELIFRILKERKMSYSIF